MKPLILSSFLLFAMLAADAQSGIKTNGTAYPIGARNGEINLFQNSRYGTGRKSEIELHPLAFFIMPHIHYKKYWLSFPLFKRKIAFATRHGIYYPQIVLDFSQSQAIIPESYRSDDLAPFALGFNNELLFSTFLQPASHCDAPNHLITLRIGAKYAYNADTLLQPNINRAVFHRETQVMHPELIWNVQLSGTGSVGNTLYYYADLAFHSYKLQIEQFSAESKLGIYGYFGQRMSAFGGVKFAYTTHPEVQAFSFYPLVNLYYTFHIKKNKRREKGLFKDGFDFNEPTRTGE